MRGRRLCQGALRALSMVLVTWGACAQEKADPPAYPHRVTGKELAAHFQETWSASGATSRATPIAFFSNADGTVRIRSLNTATVPDGFGTRQIRIAENQVCLNITTTTWRGITGCYRLVETEPKAFSLHSVKGSYRIEYRR